MYRLMKTLAQRWDPTRLTTVAMFPAQKGARGKNDPKCEGDPEPPELAVATDFASFNYRWMDYASYVKHEPQLNIFQSEASVGELQAPFVGMDREHSIGCSRTIPGEAKITIRPEGLPVVSLTVPVGRAEDSRPAAAFSL